MSPATPKAGAKQRPVPHVSILRHGSQRAASTFAALGDPTRLSLLARLSLHAEQLSVDLPVVGWKDLIAEMPKDFRATLNMLRKYARG